MVSYPINFPDTITVNQLSVMPRNAIARNMSNFTYVEQIYNFQGQMWQVSGSLPLMNRNTAEAYMSFMFKLRGRYGTFLFPLPTSVFNARGSWGGTPVVDGGAQTGDTLNIRGLPISTTNVIRQGDYINIGTGASTRLYKILDDADSNGSGEATVTIWPSLRSSPADGATIVYDDVNVLLRLEGDTPIDIDVNKNYFMQFSAMEALDGS